jgi:hypothetical protein
MASKARKYVWLAQLVALVLEAFEMKIWPLVQSTHVIMLLCAGFDQYM